MNSEEVGIPESEAACPPVPEEIPEMFLAEAGAAGLPRGHDPTLVDLLTQLAEQERALADLLVRLAEQERLLARRDEALARAAELREELRRRLAQEWR